MENCRTQIDCTLSECWKCYMGKNTDIKSVWYPLFYIWKKKRNFKASKHETLPHLEYILANWNNGSSLVLDVGQNILP